MIPADNITDVSHQVTAELMRKYALFHPVAINRGLCDQWAHEVMRLAGIGQAIWLDWDYDVAHCIFLHGDVAYDSMHPDGAPVEAIARACGWNGIIKSFPCYGHMAL